MRTIAGRDDDLASGISVFSIAGCPRDRRCSIQSDERNKTRSHKKTHSGASDSKLRVLLAEQRSADSRFSGEGVRTHTNHTQAITDVCVA